MLRKAVRPRYAFIRDNNRCWPVRLICQVLDVHPGGFYAWLKQPYSRRYHADLKLTGHIRQFWLESGCIYGYRKIYLDLRDSGQQCGCKQSLAVDATCGDKGSGRIPKSTDAQR
ncbi:hypothetical protein CCO56_02585 [Salmonella enterica subsp. enterica serovar Sundsvall]|nr:hypothetical protein CCO56_02585 [Salmonella enterica subsp. enterica serovar Sundsvall]